MCNEVVFKSLQTTGCRKSAENSSQWKLCTAKSVESQEHVVEVSSVFTSDPWGVPKYSKVKARDWLPMHARVL